MSSNIIKLDPWANLTLRIGPDDATKDFNVCSKTLARISPVFERMLYGNFAEAEANVSATASEWIVRLPEDEPNTMGRFLSIIHGEYDEAMRDFSLDQIYDLTVVTHYYDATRVLRPWVEAWITYMTNLVEDVNKPILKILWVAWELGASKLFQKTSRYILLEFDATEFHNAISNSSTQTPPEILGLTHQKENILAVREDILSSLLQPLGELLDHLLVEDEKPRWCRHAVWMGPHRCESIILGSLTWCLCKAKLWPLPDACDVHESIAVIYTHLSTLTIHDLGKLGQDEDHSICNPLRWINLQIQASLNNINLPLTQRHEAYLEKQDCALRTHSSFANVL